jgi:hypothetical protein
VAYWERLPNGVREHLTEAERQAYLRGAQDAHDGLGPLSGSVWAVPETRHSMPAPYRAALTREGVL